MFPLFVLAITEEMISSSLMKPIEAIQFYENALLTNYTVQNRSNTISLITIKIDPCRGDVDDCCEQKNEGICKDNLVVKAGPNLVVAWAFNNCVIVCSGEYETIEGCGIFLEIHMPNDEEVLSEKRVTFLISSGFHMEDLYTKVLEPGPYEIWWVERGRNGKYLQSVKPFFLL